MDEKRTASPFITLILVLTVLCVLATSVFTFGVTRTPQDYAEATMIAAVTATALPFKATEMAEGLHHQQTINATQEQVYKNLMQGLTVLAKVLFGAGGILAVMWVIAGSFKAGSVSVQAAKQAALPGFVDLGDGYRLLNDGAQVRLLDVRTGRSHPLLENGEVLPVRAEIAKGESSRQNRLPGRVGNRDSFGRSRESDLRRERTPLNPYATTYIPNSRAGL